jgi:hypothetical protein
MTVKIKEVQIPLTSYCATPAHKLQGALVDAIMSLFGATNKIGHMWFYKEQKLCRVYFWDKN